MKKVLLGLFICLSFVCLLFAGVNLHAESGLAINSGASMRTSGDHQGLKFSASVTSLEGIVEHGFYVAKGVHTKEAITAAIDADSSTVGTNKLVKKVVDGEDLDFHLVIYNMDELSEYIQDITVLAYVYDGTDYEYTSALTRNIAEVACISKQNSISSDLINDIYDEVTSNLMVKTTTQTGEFVISNVLTKKYSYSKLSSMWADFIADYNAATGASLTTSSTLSEFHTSFATGIENNVDRTFPSTCNAVKFFSGKNMVKWGWILEYFIDYGATVHITNQANGLLSYDRTCKSYDGHRLRHLGASIYNLFTEGNGMINGMASNDFTGGESKYANITWPDVTDFNGSNILNVGDNIALPSTVIDYYTFDNYYLNGDDNDTYDTGDNVTVANTPDVYTSVFTPITYSITYHTDGGSNGVGNPANYNYETATINLADASKAGGYIFVGWYNNEGFTGDPVSSIKRGSHGNKDLYAKFIREVSIVNPAWSSESNGAVVTYETVDYTIGTDAFATISAALAAASEYEQIYVLAGTYDEALTISLDNISLIGPNSEKDARDLLNREEEAVLTRRITLSGGVENINITGFKFTGDGQLYTTSDDSGSLIIRDSGVSFTYNYVDKGDNTTPVIYFNNGNRVYTNNILIDHCYITSNNKTFEPVSGKYGIVFIYNSNNLTITNSKFYNITKYAVGVFDTANGTGARGDIIVEDNVFDTISVSALWFNYYGRESASSKILIKNNRFENVNTEKVTGKAAIDLEECTAGVSYGSIKVELNVFKHCFYCLWMGASGGSVFTNNVVYKYSSDTKAIVAKGTSGYAINCASNLYLSYDGSTVKTTVKSTDGSTGYEFNANVTNVDASNYATIAAYNTATGKSFSAD